jgi:hypothetical protein
VGGKFGGSLSGGFLSESLPIYDILTHPVRKNYYRQKLSNPNKTIGLDFQIAKALGIRLATPTIPLAGI